jgi:SAM-dependent methyltransferase
MQKRSVSEDDLRRLKDEREAADRRYNEALSELDAAVQPVPPFPHPPPAPDETQVTPLNAGWDILAARQPSSGWRGRLASLVWRLVEPSLARQQSFNAALVDHINRNVTPQREVPKSIESTIASLREQIERLAQFESRLIVFLQQITPYVDTKDYEFRGLGQRIVEDVGEAHAETTRILGELGLTVRGLSATVGFVSDDMLKKWERYEGLRTSIATLQLSIHALRRELENPQAAGVVASAASAPAGTAPSPQSDSSVSHALSSNRLESHKYLIFEDVFRGDPDLIRERQQQYLPLFRGRSDVLDIGCGRGEFLQLLKDAGITARGIDINHAMAVHCVERGFDAHEGDALEYLRGLPADALGGLIAAQVVEHLQPDYLLALLEDAFRVLRPGSPIALETINVASWSAFFTGYVRDLTHARPIHHDTLRFFVQATGFLDVEIRFSARLPDEEKLRSSPREVRDVDLRTTGVEGRAILHLADAFDANASHLNRQLYGPQDYAVIAWKR